MEMFHSVPPCPLCRSSSSFVSFLLVAVFLCLFMDIVSVHVPSFLQLVMEYVGGGNLNTSLRNAELGPVPCSVRMSLCTVVH